MKTTQKAPRVSMRLIEGIGAVVLDAPQRMSLLDRVVDRVRRGQVPTAMFVHQAGDTYLAMGTPGHGIGRVAYRLDDRVRDEPWNLTVWERIA